MNPYLFIFLSLNQLYYDGEVYSQNEFLISISLNEAALANICVL